MMVRIFIVFGKILAGISCIGILLQGIRMIFAVLLPMIIGPNIGAAVIRGSDSTYIELGQVKSVPTPGIYLAAAIVLLLCALPILWMKKCQGGGRKDAGKSTRIYRFLEAFL